MKKIFMLFLAVITGFVLVSSANAEVKGKEVTYRAGKTVLKGYIASDTSLKGKLPAVLVVHEWWGHNDYARKRAEMLAKEGFVALAVDMYGDGKTADHPKDAKAFAAEVSGNKKVAAERFNAAMKFLKKQKNVNSKKIAAIGYCFGGGIVLNMARSGADLKVAASFHGSLATDRKAEKGKVKAKVLVFNGEADKMVAIKDIADFREEMKNAGVDYSYTGYPDVKHAFTNPDADKYAEKFSLPLAYDKNADEDSWNKTIAELKRM